MGDLQRQRSIRAKARALSLAGLGLVIGGVFALGPIAWLGITMIALGFWPAMLAPILLLVYVQDKLGRGERSTASVATHPKTDQTEASPKLSWRKIGPRGVQVACILGAFIISIARGYPTWELLLVAVVLAFSLVMFAIAVTAVLLSRR